MTGSGNCAKFVPNMPNAHKLERELSVGRYDLARLAASKRWSAAKRYIAAHEMLRKLEWDGKNLELAAELSNTWSRST